MRVASAKLEAIIFASFIFLLVWLPIPLGSNRPWAWSIMELLIAMQSLGLVYCFRHNIPWHYLRPGVFLLVALALFQLFTVLQLVSLPAGLLEWLAPNNAELRHRVLLDASANAAAQPLSLDPEQTKISLLKGVSYLLLALNTLLLVNRPKRIRTVLVAIVVSGTFQAFYGAMLLLSNTEQSPVFGMDIGPVATGSYVYKNHFANYLLLSLMMGLALIVADLKVNTANSWRVQLSGLLDAALSPKMLVRMCMIIMVIGLVMSRSRMGNSAFFATTLIGGVLALLLYRQRPKTLTVLIVSMLLIDVLIVSSMFGLSKVRERLSSTVLVDEGRIYIFDWALNMFKDFPVFGSGAGSFYSVFQAYLPQPISAFFDHTHNDYLQFAIESGLPITLLLGAAVLWVAYRCLTTLNKRNDPLMKGTALGCFMAITAMLIHISVDFNLQAPANAATFVVILSLALIASHMPKQGYDTKKLSST
ncbi:O-antigen ligase family protein [Agarivorans sp. Toyoura001]|uniref:O-antigen ligase family protein n=1 Tax=unclassified Agarivorans TaxID=2636026 RepID=UPI0010E26312|nr:O-antigen ligase family protein [Agarivorans sp. Toyoura001]GDY24301.1 polymerase [Agarivorans sp. Toyoura001]